MNGLLISGTAHPPLTAALAGAAGLQQLACPIERFPDGEIDVEVPAAVRGRAVYLCQPLFAAVGEGLLELALLADAARRGGATQVTAVIPYLGYARQDRRERGREALGARVVAELLGASRIDQLVCVDLHSRAVEGCFPWPVEHASGVPALVERLKGLPPNSVVVSPDLGAVKRAEAVARPLGLPVAVVHKQRLSGDTVSARGVVGEVKGRHAIVVDDMISTGGTLEAAVHAVLEAGAQPMVTVVATHGLFVGPAAVRLAALPLSRVVVTDSLPTPKLPGVPLEVVSIAPALAEVLRRLEGET
jgi:ribose-phosphate pyrophosphokinase